MFSQEIKVLEALTVKSDISFCFWSVTPFRHLWPFLTQDHITQNISPVLQVPLGEKTDRPAAKEEEELPFMPESARPLFSEQPGVLDFNPIIDEMFERTEKLLHRWDVMSQNGEINKEV